MNNVTLIPLVDILASSIAPVTLITGTAFLTSIMSPRYGRCIDRIRNIIAEISTLSKDSKEYNNLTKQLDILYKRTKILRNTMTAAGICILFVVLTIICTFSYLFFGLPGPGATLVVFILALISLVILTIGFIYDFMSSLRAVKLEIQCGSEKDEVLLLKYSDHSKIKANSHNPFINFQNIAKPFWIL